MTEPIAIITGAGIVSSIGLGRAEVHQALLQGRVGISENPALEALACRASATLVEYDSSQYLNRRQARMLDRATRGLLSSVHQAMADAGNPTTHYPSTLSGVVAVSTYTASGNLILFHREALVSGPRFVNPLFFNNTMYSTHMMQASLQHHLQGVTLSVSSGGTASLDGLLHATHALRSGAQLMVLAGSENVFFELQEYFLRAGLLASSAEGAWRCAPYDVAGSGTILGECAAALVLEQPALAAARGGRCLAEVLAVVSRTGEPERALIDALDQVFNDAEVQPREIRFVIGSGNGVAEQDRKEAAALSQVLAASPPITSLKGSMGECMSVAGLSQIIAAIQTGATGRLPPVIGTSSPIPELRLPLVRGEPLQVERGLVLVTSVAHMGGVAVALLRV